MPNFVSGIAATLLCFEIAWVACRAAPPSTKIVLEVQIVPACSLVIVFAPDNERGISCVEIYEASPLVRLRSARFLNAIGAIDGTHIPVVVRKSKQPRFWNRKGFTSQNMMATVSFDHNFLFVCTGWEGSAADMRVLRWTCESGGFTVPEGKYYLVDSGYANTDRFLAPYRGERYHISQYGGNTGVRTHRSPRDLYNHRHAQLRNVVEKTFGILKKRFKILTVATPFPYRVQCQIAMACCVIHNFIRRHQGADAIFNEELEEEPMDLDDEDTGDNAGSIESRRGDALRTFITNQLWNSRT